jgi:hypothetical protein
MLEAILAALQYAKLMSPIFLLTFQNSEPKAHIVLKPARENAIHGQHAASWSRCDDSLAAKFRGRVNVLRGWLGECAR